MTDNDVLTPGTLTALHHIAEELHAHYDGIFGTETIEALRHDSYTELAKTATVTRWLVIGTEKFAKQRLDALAHAEIHPDGRLPAALFLCVHNAGRSQMALGFFQKLAEGKALGWSAGSTPAEQISDAVLAAMDEVGIDIRQEFPKPLSDEVLQAADVVVTMGCGDACPLLPGKRYEDWDLQDPNGLDVADVRPIRDEIEQRIRRLLTDLVQPAALP